MNKVVGKLLLVLFVLGVSCQSVVRAASYDEDKFDDKWETFVEFGGTREWMEQWIRNIKNEPYTYFSKLIDAHDFVPAEMPHLCKHISNPRGFVAWLSRAFGGGDDTEALRELWSRWENPVKLRKQFLTHDRFAVPTAMRTLLHSNNVQYAGLESIRLMEKYAPIAYLHPDETYFPMLVEEYFNGTLTQLSYLPKVYAKSTTSGGKRDVKKSMPVEDRLVLDFAQQNISERSGGRATTRENVP